MNLAANEVPPARFRQVDSFIVEQQQVAESTFKLRIEAAEIASAVVPGQFVMIRLAGVNAPLIGRAMAVFDVVDQKFIDLVYVRKGNLTKPLSASPVGTPVSLWGPLGNGFRTTQCDELIMAVGGIGQTPMLMLGRDALNSGWANRATLLYGARRQSLLACVEEFSSAGLDVVTCTDDGSSGRQARVPEVLLDHLSAATGRVRVVTCGPEIMMEKVAEVCRERSVDCQVSMETPMACGIGICYSCVAKVRCDNAEVSDNDTHDVEANWDYKRTCIEGPIFDADSIVWE